MAAVIIQARMGSRRLPGKSLADLGGQPVIDWVVERSGAASTIDEVIVATSVNADDDPLADHVERHGGAAVVRGSSSDVLGRYAMALETTEADVIVRITGDCPFVQPNLIDQAVREVATIDYVATGIDGRFPRGFDIEAIRRDALLLAEQSTSEESEREHVTLFIARHPELFASRGLECPPWARRPDLRLTLDEHEDLQFLSAVVTQLGATPSTPLSSDLTAFLDLRPDLVSINAEVEHNSVT